MKKTIERPTKKGQRFTINGSKEVFRVNYFMGRDGVAYNTLQDVITHNRNSTIYIHIQSSIEGIRYSDTELVK